MGLSADGFVYGEGTVLVVHRAGERIYVGVRDDSASEESSNGEGCVLEIVNTVPKVAAVQPENSVRNPDMAAVKTAARKDVAIQLYRLLVKPLARDFVGYRAKESS